MSAEMALYAPSLDANLTRLVSNPRYSRGRLTADCMIAIDCGGDIGALRRSERAWIVDVASGWA